MTHCRLIVVLASIVHQGLAAVVEARRRLTAAALVVARHATLGGIVQSDWPRENERALHLCDRILGLVGRSEAEESVAFRLACLHVKYHLCFVYRRVLLDEVCHEHVVRDLGVEVADVDLVVRACIGSCHAHDV